MSAPLHYTIDQATQGLQRIATTFHRSWEGGAATAALDAIHQLEQLVLAAGVAIESYLDEPPEPDPHTDDLAVDRFASAMKAKLAKARDKGRGGWDDPAQCAVDYLQTLLVEHIAKGDPVDVGNFAMMLFNRGTSTAMPARILTCVYCGHEYPQGTPPHGAQVLTDHIKLCPSHPLRKAEADIVRLRQALAGLIGANDDAELRNMEIAMRLMPAPDADKAAAINGIHALLATSTGASSMPVIPMPEPARRDQSR